MHPLRTVIFFETQTHKKERKQTERHAARSRSLKIQLTRVLEAILQRMWHRGERKNNSRENFSKAENIWVSSNWRVHGVPNRVKEKEKKKSWLSNSKISKYQNVCLEQLGRMVVTLIEIGNNKKNILVGKMKRHFGHVKMVAVRCLIGCRWIGSCLCKSLGTKLMGIVKYWGIVCVYMRAYDRDYLWSIFIFAVVER